MGFESWLERDHVMALDFDQAVVGIASQPFWLRWFDDAGARVSHAPDFFARRRDGTGLVVDCRPAERRPSRDLDKFDATARACALLGWEYRLVGATDPILTANVRWLSGYRHPRHRLPDVARRLADVVAGPLPLMVAAESVGDPIAVLPVLFHLSWHHDLVVDLTRSLGQRTFVGPPGGVW